MLKKNIHISSMTKFVFQYYDDSGTIPDISFELNGEHKYIAFTLDKADATVAGCDCYRLNL